MNRWLPSILLTLAACFLTSCGSYHNAFAKAAADLPQPPKNAEGPWQGTWLSDVNAHTGPLWCIVEPNAGVAGHYDFRYRAGWGVFRFGDYTHTVAAVPAADGSIRLSGKMELPGGFGTYQVDGTLTHDTFKATYRSKADRGTMTLTRPVAGR